MARLLQDQGFAGQSQGDGGPESTASLSSDADTSQGQCKPPILDVLSETMRSQTARCPQTWLPHWNMRPDKGWDDGAVGKWARAQLPSDDVPVFDGVYA